MPSEEVVVLDGAPTKHAYENDIQRGLGFFRPPHANRTVTFTCPSSTATE